MSSIAVVLSAGVGARFGTDFPKQYHEINGRMIITYVIDALQASQIDEIIVVCGNTHFAKLVTDKFNLKTIIGGNTRNISIKNALDYVNNYTKHDKILFCDSARPNLNAAYINDCLKKLDAFDSVITTQKITDSLGKSNKIALNREDYFLIQTPECFKVPALKNFKLNSKATAIVQQLARHKSIYYNFNLKNNIKITYQEDLKLAAALMGSDK